jgi:hypothetical protein
MKAIRVAVSAAGIAAMVAVVASGQMALVAADGELSLRSYLRSIPMHKQWNSEFNAFFACRCRNWSAGKLAGTALVRLPNR